MQIYFVLFIAMIAIRKTIVGEESAEFVPSPEACWSTTEQMIGVSF